MNKVSSNFVFLQKYQQLQYGIMYDELYDIGFAMLGYSKTDASTFWNVALVESALSERQMKQVEAKFLELGRQVTFYFESSQELNPFAQTLLSCQYKKDYEDCFQFWQNGQITEKYFDDIKKVSDQKDLKIFLEVFDKCYEEDDPQNPYGKLGDYLKVTKKVWDKHHISNRLEYFLVYRGNEPVAVSTLTNHNGIGYISNVGSLRKVRGQGYGKAATLYCVAQSIKNSNSEHFLATEEGHYPNDFYKQIGFATRFSAVGYTKNS